MLQKSRPRPNHDIFPLTNRTFIDIFFGFFTDFFWWQLDGVDEFFVIFAPKSHLPAVGIEGGFSFFAKCWHIDEIRITGCHKFFHPDPILKREGGWFLLESKLMIFCKFFYFELFFIPLFIKEKSKILKFQKRKICSSNSEWQTFCHSEKFQWGKQIFNFRTPKFILFVRMTIIFIF